MKWKDKIIAFFCITFLVRLRSPRPSPSVCSHYVQRMRTNMRVRLARFKRAPSQLIVLLRAVCRTCYVLTHTHVFQFSSVCFFSKKFNIYF
jgi:hypothetical protein